MTTHDESNLPEMPDIQTRCGLVAIVGRPNVGKSTLLNRLLGQKVSITSRKPQTTRHRILGILNRPGTQFVFLDTPGIHAAKGKLNLKIVEAALAAVADVDLILFLCDVSVCDPVSEEMLLASLKKQSQPVILALNKIDCIQKTRLLDVMAKWASASPSRPLSPFRPRPASRWKRSLTP